VEFFFFFFTPFVFANDFLVHFPLFESSLGSFGPGAGLLENAESVREQSLLYGVVQTGLDMERGGVVNFKQDGILLFVEHNVEPEYFETHVGCVVVGLARLLLVDELLLHGNQSLDD